MAEVQASDAASGHYLDPAVGSMLTQGGSGGSAALPPAPARAYLEVSAAAQGSGAEGVHSRSREDGSPRIGGGSRDHSADRSPPNAPCGIMKVGSNISPCRPFSR